MRLWWKLPTNQVKEISRYENNLLMEARSDLKKKKKKRQAHMIWSLFTPFSVLLFWTILHTMVSGCEVYSPLYLSLSCTLHILHRCCFHWGYIGPDPKSAEVRESLSTDYSSFGIRSVVVCSQLPCEEGLLVPVLQMRKLRCREYKWSAWDLKGKWAIQRE